jgi:protein-S-isoprenylcysteine O-methyltransferase Ste14
MTRDEMRHRFEHYERERSWVAAAAFAPFLIIYLLVHTKYLRPYLPQSRSAEVVALLVIPAVWCAALMLLHRWLGPARYGVTCPRCGHRLAGAALYSAVRTGQCGYCGQPVADEPGS